MAVARVSPGYPDTIGPVTEGGKHKLGTYPGRAGNPDDSEVRRVLKTAYACQVGSAVAAPVAKKRRYSCFPVIHFYSPN